MEYFVCYIDGTKGDGTIAMSNCIVTMSKDINCSQDITEMKLAIANGVEEDKSKMIVVNFIKL